MTENTRSYLSLNLEGTIWTMMPVPDRSLIIIELRNEGQRRVTFLAYDYEADRVIWQQQSLPDPWWINLSWVSDRQAFLKIFEDTNNPDRTRLLALNLESGELQEAAEPAAHTNPARLPFHYVAGEPDFDTVKNFIVQQLEIIPFGGLEYLEYGTTLVISFYHGEPGHLCNTLVGFSTQGTLLWKQEIGMNLKGIGVNTFFMVADRLFFVKNKSELVTFRIV